MANGLLRMGRFFGELTPQGVQVRPDIPLSTVAITDAEGATVGFGTAATSEAALYNAAFLAAAANLCTGLPVDGMMSRRFAVVDVDPNDPFGGPSVPPVRLRMALAELLVAEDALANPERAVMPADQVPNPKAVEGALIRLRIRRRGLLAHLAAMLDMNELNFVPAQPDLGTDRDQDLLAAIHTLLIAEVGISRGTNSPHAKQPALAAAIVQKQYQRSEILTEIAGLIGMQGVSFAPAPDPGLPLDAIAMLEDMESVLRTALCEDRTDAIKTELRGLYLRYQDFREKHLDDLPLPKADQRRQMHLAEMERTMP